MGARKREIIILVLVFVLYIVSSWLTDRYGSQLAGWEFFNGVFGIFVYVSVFIVSVVIAPFETLPLLPIAVGIWGPLATALLSIIGWTAGALIAFILARVYGQKLVCRLVGKCDLEEYDFGHGKFSVFWMIVLARIVLPVDIVSYIIGLFTNIKLPLYLFATVVGVIPFAFIFAYGVKLPLPLQIIAGLVLVTLFIVYYSKIKKIFAFRKKR